MIFMFVVFYLLSILFYLLSTRSVPFTRTPACAYNYSLLSILYSLLSLIYAKRTVCSNPCLRFYDILPLVHLLRKLSNGRERLVAGFEPLRFDCIKNNTKALPWCYFLWSGLRGSNPPPSPWQGDALPNELNPHWWCLRSESNQRHGDFQSPALPTELQRLIKQGLLI